MTEASKATLQYLLLCPVVRVFRIPITAGALFLPFYQYLHECLHVVIFDITGGTRTGSTYTPQKLSALLDMYHRQ